MCMYICMCIYIYIYRYAFLQVCESRHDDQLDIPILASCTAARASSTRRGGVRRPSAAREE